MTLSGDALFYGLIVLGAFLMMFSFKVRNVLVSSVTFMVWFALGMWLFLSPAAPIGFGEVWQDVLGWAFLVLAVMPLLFAMDSEIQHESQGKRWTKYGQPPVKQGPTEYESYRDLLYNRTRRK